jgi:CRP-like cAMP-binding protein
MGTESFGATFDPDMKQFDSDATSLAATDLAEAHVFAEGRVGVDALLQKLRARDEMTAEEEQVLRDAVTEEYEIGPGRRILKAGSDLQASLLLISGFVARYRDLASGERQIQELHVAGDFVDLHGFLLKKLDHNIGSVSHCRFAIVPHDTLKRITEEYPHLSRMLWFSTLLDASIQRETIVSVGRRSACARIAHLMCELRTRLGVIGQADDQGFALPVIQADLADATGLTSVHVNRMLKLLRDDGIMTFRQNWVTIHDWDRLVEAAEFDNAYLHLEYRPR